jgi:DNA-directed RNA polymerase subunit RPC12/RpoP
LTTPPEKITVECPECSAVYGDWFRASMNLMLDDFDEAYIEEASSATCPHCNCRVSLEVLIVEPDGVWRSIRGD